MFLLFYHKIPFDFNIHNSQFRHIFCDMLPTCSICYSDRKKREDTGFGILSKETDIGNSRAVLQNKLFGLGVKAQIQHRYQGKRGTGGKYQIQREYIA